MAEVYYSPPPLRKRQAPTAHGAFVCSAFVCRSSVYRSAARTAFMPHLEYSR
jgi:hypothetical protein